MKAKVILYLIIAVHVVLMCSCVPWETEWQMLKRLELSDGRTVYIYYVDKGATTKEVIQVRIGRSRSDETVVVNFEKNMSQNAKLLNDSILMVAVTDSGSAEIDTSFVKLKR
jgi:hypothetical protein